MGAYLLGRIKRSGSGALSGVERGGGRLFWNVICDVIAAPATVIGNIFGVLQAEWLFLIAALVILTGAVYRRMTGSGGGGRGRRAA